MVFDDRGGRALDIEEPPGERVTLDPAPLLEVRGISTSVIKKALETGEIVATGNAMADPELGTARSIVSMDLRTIVCIPLSSPRSEVSTGGPTRALGALYVDNIYCT